jgi:hypothetical protein
MESVKHFCRSYEDKFKLSKIWKHADWDITSTDALITTRSLSGREA